MGLKAGARNASPRAQAEAGVVPGTAHRIADNEAVGERTVVVAAVSRRREDLLADAYQQHLVLADMTGQHAAVGEFCEGDALGQVGAAGLGLIVGHFVLLERRWGAWETSHAMSTSPALSASASP